MIAQHARFAQTEVHCEFQPWIAPTNEVKVEGEQH
jgi:hypothetical protein